MPRNGTLRLIFLTSLGILIAGAFYYFYTFNPSTASGHYLQCPSRMLLGIYCPGCGTQRAIHHLLHGDIGAALRYNPMMVLFIPLSLILVVQWVLRYFGKRYWHVPLFYQPWFTWTLFILFTVYFIVRNLPFATGSWLQPPD